MAGIGVANGEHLAGPIPFLIGLAAATPFVSQPPGYTGPMVSYLGDAGISWLAGFFGSALNTLGCRRPRR